MGRAAAIKPLREVQGWEDEADVIVVGLGAAGACAALEATSAGADTLVLERASGGGGTSALSTGQIYLGGGTPIQEKCGFEDSPEEMYKYLMASCGPGVDEPKIRLFCDHCVEHFHWLVAQGVPFKETYYGDGSYTPTDDCLSYSGSELAHPYRDVAKPAPRGHTVQQETIEAGAMLMRRLLESVDGCGARIQVDTLCETLVVDEQRRVVGVVARVDGSTRHLRARGGVILTAGGFINNTEMVERYAPMLRKCKMRLACDGDDGRGIRMGMGAGGEAVRMETASIVLPFTVPKTLIQGVMVNRQGQRFINEDAYQTVVGEAALHGQDGQVYLIVDDAIYEQPFPPTEIAAVGETFEELERELGFAEGSLQSTLELYNRNAERGEDPVFHKASPFLVPLVRPPFAALDYTTDTAIWAVFTMGGLRTAPDGAVLTPDGDVIPGLFAAGRTTSGLAAQGYSSGLSLADGTFFGRRAGRAAAAPVV
ncbi:MAG: flavoprotein [Deltaproteobacteria bacterium]|jgi:succinate dehydrogenase/fumarate reductase flavoprotein subunit|nr:flavoprotein [Deltaproteobacteria bacterium]